MISLRQIPLPLLRRLRLRALELDDGSDPVLSQLSRQATSADRATSGDRSDQQAPVNIDKQQQQEPQEHKEFLASWASMRCENDYRHIVDEMEQKAKAGGITLPKFQTGAAPSR